ncbi:MAG: hypothetical protein QM736_01770 [Vicinamibacterales bacterium]
MSLSEARLYLANTIAEWRNIRLSDLQFWHGGDARLLVFGLAALAVFVLVARSFLVRQPGRHRIVVPALPATLRPSYLSFIRHTPLLLFLAGIPFLGTGGGQSVQLARHQRGVVSRAAHRNHDRRVDEHANAVQGGAPEHARRDRCHLLHHRGRGRTLHQDAHGAELPRSDGAGGVRQRGVRGDAVHERLRQHPAERLAHRRSGRVLALPRSGDDHRRRNRAGDGTLQGVQLPRCRRQHHDSVLRRRGHARAGG